MQLSFIICFVAVATISIIHAAPNPIRFVTPRPGIDYKIRTVTPNPRIRYLRSINEDGDQLQLYPIIDEIYPRRNEEYRILPSRHRFVQFSDEDDILEDVNFDDEFDHTISKRSPERVVINWKPPPPNGPRYARSADLQENENFEE